MQGKRKDQIKFSTKMVALSFIGLLFIISITVILFYAFPVKLESETMHGPPHNYWSPTNKQSKDWTETTQGNDTTYLDEDVMWIGGNGDTIWE